MLLQIKKPKNLGGRWFSGVFSAQVTEGLSSILLLCPLSCWCYSSYHWMFCSFYREGKANVPLFLSGQTWSPDLQGGWEREDLTAAEPFSSDLWGVQGTWLDSAGTSESLCALPKCLQEPVWLSEEHRSVMSRTAVHPWAGHWDLDLLFIPMVQLDSRTNKSFPVMRVMAP